MRAIYLFALAAGCTRNVGTVQISLVTSPNVEENPLPDDQELTIEVRVEGPGAGVHRASDAYLPGETRIEVPGVSVGEDRVITVTVRTGAGAVFARGRTLPIDIVGDETVQIYVSRVNRSSQAFSPVAVSTGLRSPRFGQVALSLPDRRILIAAGGAAILDGSSTRTGELVDFAEIFDPTRGQIVTDRPDCAGIDRSRCLFVPRVAPVGALDVDGAVFLAGGDAVGGPTADGERFAEGRFEAAASLSAPRARAAGFATAGGIVVAGGLEIDGEDLVPSAEAELLFRRESRTAGTLSVARWASAAAVAPDDRGIVAGGFVDRVPPASSCAEEPESFCREHFLSATPCDIETGLCRGDRSGNVTDAIDLYDPAEGTFRASVEGLVVPRASSTATALADGRFVVIGGLVDENPAEDAAQNLPTSSIEVYDPSQDVSCEVGSLTQARWLHAAVALDDRVVVFGGYAASGIETLDTVEIVDLRGVRITPGCAGALTRGTDVPGLRLRPARAGHTATLMDNGAVLVAGGTTGPAEGVTDKLEIFWIE